MQNKLDEIPGRPLYPYINTPYGLKEYKTRRKGDGTNRLRGITYAQPGALKPGDILVTGETVLSESREGYNGTILVHLSHWGGPDDKGVWIGVPARIPIAIKRSA